MLLYLAVLLFCFLLSTVKTSKSIENSALIFIALFLCFGYMTGSDWYNYELFYNNPDFSKESGRLEFGYVLLQTIIGKLGVGFWVFHIIVKLLVFYSIINFVRWFNINIFIFLAFFLPEIGFYLFIDCPFRNLIAFGFAIIAFKNLLENKTIRYFIYVLIALSFHLSAAIMIPIYFVYRKNLKTYIVLIAALLIYLLSFNIDFLMSNLFLPLTKLSPLLSERLKFYFLNSHFISDKISFGVFIRFFVFLILLLFKEVIINGDKKRQYVFNLSIIFLFLYPIANTMKIFYRFSIFISPFYVLSIVYLLNSFRIKLNKYILISFFMLLYMKQTYSLVTYDYKYVPYTNYIYYWTNNDFPNIKYRQQFNPTHSPYKKLTPQK